MNRFVSFLLILNAFNSFQDTKANFVSNGTCPLEDFTVFFVNRNQYVSLNMTWNPVENDEKVSIDIFLSPEETRKSCFSSPYPFFKHSLINNTVDFEHLFVSPGCSYEIEIRSEESNSIYCNYNYSVPECVGKICDCEQFTSKANITKVTHVEGKTFLVEWDLSNQTVNNRSYELQPEIDFTFHKKNLGDFARESVKILATNCNESQAEVAMGLVEGEDYVLTGYFQNNFSCTAVAAFYFTAPTKPCGCKK